MNCEQLRKAIEEILDFCDFRYTQAIVDMILGTACVESNCGEYIEQINGPARGIFQIEPKTARDIYTNFIQYNEKLKYYYDILFNEHLTLEQNLKFNLAFSIFMCRIFYMRFSEPIPNTLEKQAEYWKKYYNTKLGKGTVDLYIMKGKKYGNL